MSTTAPPQLSGRFDDALGLAREIHGGARRSGTGIPFMAHLLVVTGLVLEDGGDEDEAVAAMLHDAVEEAGGRVMLDRIERTFGERVAEIVGGLSDNLDVDASTWVERKRRYLSHLQSVDDARILRVALADKVHNARSLVRELRTDREAVAERSPEKSPEDQLSYYRCLLAFFAVRRPGSLTEDLRQAVAEIERLLTPPRA